MYLDLEYTCIRTLYGLFTPSKIPNAVDQGRVARDQQWRETILSVFKVLQPRSLCLQAEARLRVSASGTPRMASSFQDWQGVLPALKT
jgi:hypothetical protein